MLKFITNLFLCFILFCNTTYQNTSLTSHFKNATSITITNSNKEFTFEKNSREFNLILESIFKITKNHHEMPAFSVALDQEIKTSKQSGLWLEMNFNKTQTHNELCFDSLIFEINENYSGLNLIRKTNDIYSGRCFYLNLENNMHELKNNILKILNQQFLLQIAQN